MSWSIALRRSPKPGALTAAALNVPRILLTTRVARASPSTSSAMMTSGRPVFITAFERRQQRLHRGDLGLVDQQVGLIEHGLLALRIGDEVRRQEALVELHPLGELELGAERVRLLDGDHAVLADLVDRLGDDLADRRIGGRDRRHGGDVGLLVDVLGLRLDRLDGGGDGLLDALLEAHRVGPGSDVAHAVGDHRLGEHGGRRRAVTGDVVGLRRHFLDELGAHVLERVVELDFLGDRDTVVGDRRGAPLLVEDDVAALGPERHLDGVGELVDTRLEGAARFLVELDDLGHVLRPRRSPGRHGWRGSAGPRRRR